MVTTCCNLRVSLRQLCASAVRKMGKMVPALKLFKLFGNFNNLGAGAVTGSAVTGTSCGRFFCCFESVRNSCKQFHTNEHECSSTNEHEFFYGLTLENPLFVSICVPYSCSFVSNVSTVYRQIPEGSAS